MYTQYLVRQIGQRLHKILPQSVCVVIYCMVPNICERITFFHDFCEFPDDYKAFFLKAANNTGFELGKSMNHKNLIRSRKFGAIQ